GRILHARLFLDVRRHAGRAVPDAHPGQRAGLLLQQRAAALGRRAVRDRSIRTKIWLRLGDRRRRAVLRARRRADLAAAGDERSGAVIDISADMGEGSPGEDEIWPLINSANVACGGHIGDADSMAYAVRRAREHGVRLGAHPSYPDRENFGRKSMSMTPAALR